MMFWVVLSAVFVIVAGGCVARLAGVRLGCLRRSDCCGRGCGCLLPRRRR